MESTLCYNENKNAIELENTQNKLKLKRGVRPTYKTKQNEKSHFVIQRPMSIQFRVRMT